jgi:hypothetical protein
MDVSKLCMSLVRITPISIRKKPGRAGIVGKRSMATSNFVPIAAGEYDLVNSLIG